VNDIAAKVEPLFDNETWAVVVTPLEVVNDGATWVAANREMIEGLLVSHPLVLLRDIGVVTDADFTCVRDVLIPHPADYIYRSTPRTAVGERVLTTTEYPATREILLHCENAYQRDWPLRMMFGCIKAPKSGGQTPFAYMPEVTEALAKVLGEEQLNEFEKRGVRYLRNYHEGFDLDWRTVFQSNDPRQIEAYCDANGLEYAWHSDGHLKTSQRCQAIAHHPLTGERLWFNQAHLFHPTALGDEVLEDLLDIFGEEGLPRDARYGDGEPIDPALLASIREVFAEASRQFDWQEGDITLFDNMRAAHARRPFTGERRVLVSMGDMMSGYAEPKKIS
jgi:alpha-ketoglutarate-dependent taurine dioxygenase